MDIPEDFCSKGITPGELRSLTGLLRGAPAVPLGLYAALARRATEDCVTFSRAVPPGSKLALSDLREVAWWFSGVPAGERLTGAGASAAAAVGVPGTPAGSWTHTDRGFLEALAPRAAAQLELIHPALVVYLLWAFAKAEMVVPGFFQVAGDRLARDLEQLDSASLGTASWCFAKLHEPHPELFRLVSREVLRRECAAEAAVARGEVLQPAECLTPQAVQNLFWAYARLGRGAGADRVCCEEMLESLRARAQLLLSHGPHEPRPAACADTAQPAPEPFRLMSCAIMAQACVDLDLAEASFFASLAGSAVRGLRAPPRSPEAVSFVSDSGEDLLLLLRAYARASVPRRPLRELARAALPHAAELQGRLSAWAEGELRAAFKAAGLESHFEETFGPAVGNGSCSTGRGGGAGCQAAGSTEASRPPDLARVQ